MHAKDGAAIYMAHSKGGAFIVEMPVQPNSLTSLTSRLTGNYAVRSVLHRWCLAHLASVILFFLLFFPMHTNLAAAAAARRP